MPYQPSPEPANTPLDRFCSSDCTLLGVQLYPVTRYQLHCPGLFLPMPNESSKLIYLPVPVFWFQVLYHQSNNQKFEAMLSFLSSISPILAIIGFMSWTGYGTSVFGKPLYLRDGVWKILRWVGVPLVIFGMFFFSDPISEKTVNIPMILGSILLLIGSARTTKRPSNTKPLFKIPDSTEKKKSS